MKGKSIAYAIANKPYEKREDILIDLREKFSISSAVLYKNDGSISAISESNPIIRSSTISLEDIRRGQNGCVGRIGETKERNRLLKEFSPSF